MNTIILMLTIILATVQNTNQEDKVFTITATVINVNSNKGTVNFALYDKENFLRIPIKAENGKIDNNKSSVVFKNIPVGEYAVVCYHDYNENDQLDFSDNGMPMEDYGTSNNVYVMGPPRFDNAKFKVVNKNISLEIKF